MDKTDSATQDSPLVTGQTSDSKAGTTPNNAPKTYTEAELTQAIEKAKSDALAQAGRERKVIEDENKTLKSQLSTNQTLISETQDKMKKLTSEIEDLSADDPDKQKLIKKLRDLEDKEDTLKAEKKALEAEKATHAEAIKKAQEFSLREVASKVASEFKNGNAEKLRTICSKRNITSEDEIRELASTFWDVNVIEPAKKPEIEVTSVNGVTSGGSNTFTADQIARMPLSEYAKNKSKIDEAYRAGNIKK